MFPNFMLPLGIEKHIGDVTLLALVTMKYAANACTPTKGQYNSHGSRERGAADEAVAEKEAMARGALVRYGVGEREKEGCDPVAPSTPRPVLPGGPNNTLLSERMCAQGCADVLTENSEDT